MRSRSFYFYIGVAGILLIASFGVFIKSFMEVHPLRYIFLLIFFIGIIVGYFRYWMKVKRNEMKNKSKWLRYGFLILFILAYMAVRNGVKALISYEVSSQDYGIVFGFFILGLFITYFGLYSVYLSGGIGRKE